MHLQVSYRRNVAKGSNFNSTDLVAKGIPKEDFITKFNVSLARLFPLKLSHETH